MEIWDQTYEKDRLLRESREKRDAIEAAAAAEKKAEQAAFQRSIDAVHRRSGKPSYVAPQVLGALVAAVWIVHRIRIEGGHPDPWWLTYALGTGASLTVALWAKTQHHQQAWNDADDLDAHFQKRNRRVLIVAFLLAQWFAFAVSYDTVLAKKTAVAYGMLLGALVIFVLVVGAARGTMRLGSAVRRNPVGSLAVAAALGVLGYVLVSGLHRNFPNRDKVLPNTPPGTGGTTPNVRSR